MEDLPGGTEDQVDNSKIHKIKYAINLIPTMSRNFQKLQDPFTNKTKFNLINEDVNLLDICAGSEEIEMFEAKALQQYIKFKWEKYAQPFHFIGCFIHFLYMVGYVVFVYETYILGVHSKTGHISEFTIVLLACLMYPTIYETT